MPALTGHSNHELAYRSVGRRRPAWMAGLLLVVASIVAALLGEGVLRILLPVGLSGQLEIQDTYPWLAFDPLLSWRNIPGYRREEFGIGDWGDRLVDGPIEHAEHAPAAPRLLLLGDSRTFGIWLDKSGLRYDSDFASYLARRTEKRLEVLNAGTIGYTSSQGLRQWMILGDEIEPDIVVVAYGMNDDLPSWNPSYRVSEPRSALARGLLYRFGTWRWVQGGFWVARRSPWSLSQTDWKPWVTLDEYRRNLERFIDESRRRHVRLLFLHLPLRPLERGENEPLIPGETPPPVSIYGVDSLSELHEVHDRFRDVASEVAKSREIPMLDVSYGFRAFRDRHPELELYSAYDLVHPNALGANVIARLLEQRLVSLGWIAPSNETEGGR